MSNFYQNLFDQTYTLSFDKVKELLPKGLYVPIYLFLVKPQYLRSAQPPNTPDKDPLYYFRRDLWIEKYKSWALPPHPDQLSQIKTIVGNRKILEIGAGSGFLAAVFKTAQLEVIATDPKIEAIANKSYTTVKKMTSDQALKKFGNKVGCLLVCWGRGFPLEESFTFFKGDMVIIIGEGPDGCTSAGCLEELSSNPNWKREALIFIPCWPEVSDYVRIYRKITP